MALVLTGCAAGSGAPIGAGGNGAAPGLAGAGGATGKSSAAPYQPYDITPLLKPKKKFLGVALPSDVPKSMAPVDAFAVSAGKSPDLLEYYLAWGDDFQADQALSVWQHGQLPYLAWEPYTATLRQLAAGVQDDYLRRTALAIRDLNVPVAISFAHEMNGDWYPWGTKGSTPADFVAAWRHVHDVFQDQGVSNVVWVWSPNIINPVPQVKLAPYYPGDGYVDWVGVVGYFAATGPRTFDTLFGPTFWQIRTFSQKPFLLAETAVQPTSHEPAEITDLLHAVAGRSDVVGLTWFDLKKEADWRIDSSPSALAAFRRGVADARYGFDVERLR